VKKTLFLLIFMLFLSGCGGPSFQSEEPFEEPHIAVINLELAERFGLFTEQQLKRALYEPVSGAYIGAYILSDRTTAGDIEAFEDIAGREHSFYTYFHKMGQPFPTEWVLNCVALMKTPSIVLTPQNMESPFDERLLRETAMRLGEIYVPIFVHLYPVSHGAAYDSDEYTAFFRTAKEYFDRYASNVALVWSMDVDSLHLINQHYPGDDYVDWVGINIFTGAETTMDEVRNSLDFFYFNFQERKPMFISQLGISHFSSRDHAYHISESSHIMEKLFGTLRSGYPRIKAVNYMSFNAIDPVNMRQGIYNFSVTDNDIMSRVYGAAIRDDFFLSRVDFAAGGEPFLQRLRKPTDVLYHEGEFYVRALIDNIGEGLSVSDIREIVNVGSFEYYPLDLAAGKTFSVHPDFNLRTVELRQTR